ncbi:MAG: hypothetical protein HY906_24130 [Deltaproteobacteria bacterium]|nr:hypothetical protein [Deltaproteobacteria bacterium]
MAILGVNAFHGDASAALVVDGQLVAAIAEERLNRQKHCAGFPTLAVRECLRLGGVQPERVDHVAISRDPFANLSAKAFYVLQNLGAAKNMAEASGWDPSIKVERLEEDELFTVGGPRARVDGRRAPVR